MNGDGFKSRKFIFNVSSVALVELVATVAFFMDKMTAGEWVSLNQWLIPLALTIYGVGNVVEKRINVNVGT